LCPSYHPLIPSPAQAPFFICNPNILDLVQLVSRIQEMSDPSQRGAHGCSIMSFHYEHTL
jgi:hypothetical protein